VRVVRVTDSNRARYMEQIVALETKVRYPLGQDFFTIDHGPDYFAFFRRLGEHHAFVAVEGDEVLAVASGILRQLPRRCWYLCDLKVRPDRRGERIPLRMLSRVFRPRYLRCPRGYAISMNPGDGSPNRVVKLVSKFRWARSSVGAQLQLYSLDAKAMAEVAPLVAQHRGALGYLSLRGRKDLLLASTGAPMPLLHVQFGPTAERGEGVSREPRADHAHMFCTPESDPLHRDLLARGFAPSATASLIQHRMPESDWTAILTSDI